MANSRNIENATGFSDINEVRKLFNKLARRENLINDEKDDLTPDINSPPTGFEPTTPDFTTPDYKNSSSPPYAPETPPYVPETPPYAPETPPYAPETPLYAPETPPYAPETPPYAAESPPHDYEMGETVLIRGDTNQLWTIIKIGPNLITTQNEQGEIRIVTKSELYSPGDVVAQLPPPDLTGDSSTVPGINFAPVFNFGNSETTPTPSVAPVTLKDELPVSSGSDELPVSNGSNNELPLDFSNFLIKKV
jgi:hypothetical protein